MVASPCDITIVEHHCAASCGTGDVAVAVVPVVRPTFDCSLLHSGYRLAARRARDWDPRRRRERAQVDVLAVLDAV